MDTTIKNEAPKHWAASLKENDQVIATIRHETDGEKNLCDVLCKVMSNSVEREKVLVEYLRNLYTVPYYDLRDISKLVNYKNIPREEGYYWVYLNSPKNFSHYGWEVAKWDGNSFWYDGDPYDEDCFSKVEETRIVHHENYTNDFKN